MKRARFTAMMATVALIVGAATIAVAPAATARGLSVRRACPAPAPGHAECLALEVTGSEHLSAFAGPSGYHPADLDSAYGLDPTKGAGQTIGIVDAFNDPNAEADLGVYRSTFGLPACTTANGCFRKVNQNGAASPLPKGNKGWGAEISLDLDMASAVCPLCHVVLVEASSTSDANLGASVNTAVSLGATEVSNSYGGGEGGSSADYIHPGIPITASTGDDGFKGGPESPADFTTVTAVGGTSLKIKKGHWTETAWSGAGSGCSTVVAKPAWQHDTGCSKRTLGDVSAVADPNTGVTIYDTYGKSGFLVYGGTSASAPIIAGVYALAGNGASINDASLAYSHTSSLFDVTKGSTGSCGGSYLCTAKKGYDGPTGLGTPDGTGAF